MNVETPFDGNDQTQDNTPTGQKKAEQGQNGETVSELYDKVVDQMEKIRKEEEQHPLISSKLDFVILQTEFESSQNFLQKVTVIEKFRFWS